MWEFILKSSIKLFEKEKDLGVKFDPSLQFSKHVAMVSNKANKMVGIIKRTFDYMDEKMLTTLYKTLVRPHLQYANCIWHPLLHKDVQTIEKVQRRATKRVSSLRDLPRVFFLGGTGGSPPSGENFANPSPSDTCPPFLDQGLSPPSRGSSIDIEYNKRLDRQRPCLEGDFSGGSNNIVQSNKSIWRRW